MRRLIDADRLRKDILNLQDCYNGFSDTYDKACIIGVIDEQPTAEKVGKWMETDAAPHRIYCSECYATFIPNKEWVAWKEGIIPRHYCPNCGALMREDGGEG